MIMPPAMYSPRKISSVSTCNYYRDVGLVSLHMYADSIADVAVDKDLAPLML